MCDVWCVMCDVWASHLPFHLSFFFPQLSTTFTSYHGMGCMRQANGDAYVGLFEKNMRMGRGMFVVADGLMWDWHVLVPCWCFETYDHHFVYCWDFYRIFYKLHQHHITTLSSQPPTSSSQSHNLWIFQNHHGHHLPISAGMTAFGTTMLPMTHKAKLESYMRTATATKVGIVLVFL